MGEHIPKIIVSVVAGLIVGVGGTVFMYQGRISEIAGRNEGLQQQIEMLQQQIDNLQVAPTHTPYPACTPCPTNTSAPTPALTITPTSPPAEEHTREVSASMYPFANTNVSIEKGHVVQVIVQGDDANWNCGKGATSAEGIFGDKWDGHVDPSANQCELIGYIREGVILRIGAYEQFEATESGSLHLGANDDPDQFDDNSGTLVVKIIVTQ